MFVEIRKLTRNGTIEPTVIKGSEIRGLAPSSRTFEGEPTTRVYTEGGTQFKVVGAYETLREELRKATKRAIPFVGADAPMDTSRTR